MQRIIATPLASRFCAPRQRSAQSPPDVRSPHRLALLHPDVRSPFRSALSHSDVHTPLRSALLHSDVRSPFRSALLHSDVRSPHRSMLSHSDVHTPLRPAADRHTRATASCSAFPALCRRTACGVLRFGNVSIYWQKNAAGCPRLFPNCLETFPFFDYSILPLFDFVNPFFSFFSILFTQDCILSPFTCNFRLLYTRQVFFFAQQPSHFTQAAIPKDCPSKAACEVGSPHKQRARSTRCPAITSKRLSTRRLPYLRLPYMCLIKTNDSKLLLIG